MIKRFFLIVAFSSIPMTAKAVMDYTHWAEGVIIMMDPQILVHANQHTNGFPLADTYTAN